MREAIDPWSYVIAAYAIGIGGTAALIVWSWVTMHRAERRRDRSRGR